MAKRRKVLLGLGSLAAGGAAAIGTGAVESVKAGRAAQGSVVGDRSAYLQIGSSDHFDGQVKYAQGQVEVQFPRLNTDAVTDFENAFYIKNTGKQDLTVEIDEQLERLDISFNENFGAEGGTENEVALPSGQAVHVDIRVDTEGIDDAGKKILGGADEADDFRIRAADAGEEV